MIFPFHNKLVLWSNVNTKAISLIAIDFRQITALHKVDQFHCSLLLLLLQQKYTPTATCQHNGSHKSRRRHRDVGLHTEYDVTANCQLRFVVLPSTGRLLVITILCSYGFAVIDVYLIEKFCFMTNCLLYELSISLYPVSGPSEFSAITSQIITKLFQIIHYM